MKNLLVLTLISLMLASCGKNSSTKTKDAPDYGLVLFSVTTNGNNLKAFYSSGAVLDDSQLPLDTIYNLRRDRPVYWVSSSDMTLNNQDLFWHVENNVATLGTCWWSNVGQGCSGSAHKDWRDSLYNQGYDNTVYSF